MARLLPTTFMGCNIYTQSYREDFLSRSSIALTEPNEAWIKTMVEQSEYTSKTELINDLVRAARLRDEELDLVRRKLEAAEKGGFSTRSQSDLLKDIKTRLGTNAKL